MYQSLEEKKGSQKSLTRKSSGEFNKPKPDYAIKLLKAHDKSQQSSARYLSELTPGLGRTSTSVANSVGMGERKQSTKMDAANLKLKANLKSIFGSTGLVQYQKKQFRLGRSLEGLGTSTNSQSLNQRHKDTASGRASSTQHQEGQKKTAVLTRSTQLPPTKKPRPPLAPAATGSNFLPAGAGGFKVQVSVEILPGTTLQQGVVRMSDQQGTRQQQQMLGQKARQTLPPKPQQQQSQQYQKMQMPQLPRAPISRGNLSQQLVDQREIRASSKSTEHNLSSILAQVVQPSALEITNLGERNSVRQIRVSREEKSNIQAEQLVKTPCGGLLVQHQEFEASQRETFIRQQQEYLQISQKTEDLEAISCRQQPQNQPLEAPLQANAGAQAKIHQNLKRAVGDSNPTPDQSKTEDSAACLSSNAKHQINWLLSDQVTKTLFEKIYRQTTTQAMSKARAAK